MVVGVVVEVPNSTQHSSLCASQASNGTECYYHAHLLRRTWRQRVGDLPAFIYTPGQIQRRPPSQNSQLPSGVASFCEVMCVVPKPRWWNSTAPVLGSEFLLWAHHTLSMHCLTVLQPRFGETSRSCNSLGRLVSRSCYWLVQVGVCFQVNFRVTDRYF